MGNGRGFVTGAGVEVALMVRCFAQQSLEPLGRGTGHGNTPSSFEAP